MGNKSFLLHKVIEVVKSKENFMRYLILNKGGAFESDVPPHKSLNLKLYLSIFPFLRPFTFSVIKFQLSFVSSA